MCVCLGNGRGCKRCHHMCVSGEGTTIRLQGTNGCSSLFLHLCRRVVVGQGRGVELWP